MTHPASTQYEGSAKAAGLRYVSDETAGIRRHRHGRGFSYIGPDGLIVRSPEMLRRFRALVIPPAWTDVWICADPDGHLQVTARDARGRKQYRYHPDFRQRRDDAKFERLFSMSEVLWKIRDRVEDDIAKPGHTRTKVMATVVWLLERTLMRIGTPEYAKANKSFGLTTLRRRHVEVAGSQLRFEFRGKSGMPHLVEVTDRRIARIVQRCQELPGQELFQFLDDAGQRQGVDAGAVNDYLREITDREITAKDFRTWAGTMDAADALRRMKPAKTKRDRERNIVRAVDETARRLGNTRTVCRKYYIHPALLDAYLRGSVLPPPAERTFRERESRSAPLRAHEREVLAFLREQESVQGAAPPVRRRRRRKGRARAG